jgi:hypothetical protein
MLPECFAPKSSSFFHLLKAGAPVKAIDGGEDGEWKNWHAAFVENKWQIFVIQHNWAKLLRDQALPQIDRDAVPPLPFDHCAFEYRIGPPGSYLLAFATTDDRVRSHIAVADRPPFRIMHWGMTFDGDFQTLQDERIINFSAAVVEATLIAMDSGVASAAARGCSDKLQKAREKRGKPRIDEYHVVDVVRRERNAHSGGGAHASPRLHFRKGHWAHNDTKRWWVKWCMVGNPDLGFIDKHYRF